MENKKSFIPLEGYQYLSQAEMIRRAEMFYKQIKSRRTVRDFSDEEVPLHVIETCLKAAGTAPNGANLQPWKFIVISDPEIKSRIRSQAEEEEKYFYLKKAPPEWLEALKPLGTDWNKPFLEIAPYIIAIFYKNYELSHNGKKIKNYYAQESVGIATGILITALHLSGLATLTHTPSPMGFLNQILKRPKNERPFLLLVVGFPAENTLVPNIQKKPLNEIAEFL